MAVAKGASAGLTVLRTLPCPVLWDGRGWDTRLPLREALDTRRTPGLSTMLPPSQDAPRCGPWAGGQGPSGPSRASMLPFLPGALGGPSGGEWETAPHTWMIFSGMLETVKP